MADHYANSKVVNVTGKDFDSSFKLKKSPKQSGLIVFHAVWCGFCVQLSGEYKKLAAKSGVKLYSIEADAEGSQEVFAHFGVTGFPTIRFLSKDGKVSSKTYLGERDVASMMKFIKSSGMSGGAKKKVVKKKKCSGKCKGKCVGGQCKKSVKKCKKCKGKCNGKQCKKPVKKCKCKGKCAGGKCKPQKGGAKKRGRGRPKDVPMKKLEKAVIKSYKKVKKMLGGKKKKKVVKKTLKKRGKK